MATTSQVSDSHFPQLFQAADAASLAGQTAYVKGTRYRLTLIVIAALAGITSWRVGEKDIDLLALIGCLAFIATLLIEVGLWRSRPDRTWYDGRAVAESAKTVAWKYAVCGQPFPASTSTGTAEVEVAHRLAVIRSQFASLELDPVNAPMITLWMTEQREAPLADRQWSYLDARIGDQKAWYSKNAKYNKKRSNQWRLVLTAFELLGATMSLIEVFTSTGLLLAPVIAAVVGAVAAWLETKQHDSLARAYSAAVSDLASAEVKLRAAQTEESWAVEVDDAEEAISREHIVWLASRSRI